MIWPVRGLLAGAVLTAPATASVSETTSYIYDALGRLERASTTGTVNNGLDVSTGYDPAGNRANHIVSGAGAAAGPAGSEAGIFGAESIEGEPEPNRPPVALDNEGIMDRCALIDQASPSPR